MSADQDASQDQDDGDSTQSECDGSLTVYDYQASPSSTPVNCSQGSLTSPAADEQSDATHELTGTLRCTQVSKPLPSGGNYSEMSEFRIKTTSY